MLNRAGAKSPITNPPDDIDGCECATSASQERKRTADEAKRAAEPKDIDWVPAPTCRICTTWFP